MFESNALLSSYGLFGQTDEVKQALLKCILGLQQPDEGEVRVLGEIPGTPGATVPGSGIGYMRSPRNLDPDLPAWGTIAFFGCLHEILSPQLLGEFSGGCLLSKRRPGVYPERRNGAMGAPKFWIEIM